MTMRGGPATQGQEPDRGQPEHHDRESRESLTRPSDERGHDDEQRRDPECAKAVQEFPPGIGKAPSVGAGQGSPPPRTGAATQSSRGACCAMRPWKVTNSPEEADVNPISE